MKYPTPKDMGGRLIREVIGAFRTFETGPTLPISSHILIGVSGGPDSMALAKLIVRYGRRVGTAQKIRLVHINHGWRGPESDGDEAFVRAAARRWRVPISVFRLKPKKAGDRHSPEEAARKQRKAIFEKLSRRYGSEKNPAWILTAHHADDLAETMVWRLFTGVSGTHGGGISFRAGQELRPFLRVRKRDLIRFLEEEGESWREDRTNFEGRLLRSKMRLELMPVVERLFPRAVENLVRWATEAQKREKASKVGTASLLEGADASILFSAVGLRVRRAHWEWLNQADQVGKKRPRKLSLPGGWTLHSEANRWVLEKLS